MKIFVTELNVNGFKNLADIQYFPSEKFNIITGGNAQGKTNLIEAIWLMTGCHSFRGTKERDFIGFDKDYAEIKLSFQNSLRTQNIVFRVCRKIKEKKILLNGIEYNGGKKLFEQFRCVAFLPSDIELAEGTPDKRRTFADMCCSQLKPSFMDCIRRYSVALASRNAVLKNIASGKYIPSQLDIWNEQVAESGIRISLARKKYISKLDNVCRKLYQGITQNYENLHINYRSCIYDNNYKYPEKISDEMKKIYISRLEESLSDDIRLGYTQYGVHRDDLSLKINGLPVKIYGSQGQKKSCCLVMKLAQAEILRNETGEPPVILLDDVMGELDASRQALVSEIISGMQVFITSCNAESILLKNEISLYNMQNGFLTSV